MDLPRLSYIAPSIRNKYFKKQNMLRMKLTVAGCCFAIAPVVKNTAKRKESIVGKETVYAKALRC